MFSNLKIRSFDYDNQSHYQTLAELFNYAYPQQFVTAFNLRMSDEFRRANLHCKRFVAELDGESAGIACIEHWAEFYHPRKFLLHLIARPDFQNKNVGATLYKRISAELRGLNPLAVYAWAQTDSNGARRFAEKRGFQRSATRWNIALDVQAFDIAPFAPALETLRRERIAVARLCESKSEPRILEKLYEFYARTVNSIQSVEIAPLPTFEQFVEERAAKSDELTFIARDNSQIIGMWQLDKDTGSRLLGDVMSVAPEYRRRNVALALVATAILYAKNQGCKILTAHTDEHNKAILHLAEKLGFKHLPAQDLFGKFDFEN